MALLRSGELGRAQQVLHEARVQTERELPQSLELARVHVALSAVADGSGDPALARTHAEHADAIIREAAGPTDPERVGALSARGVAAFRQERFADATESFALALDVAERQPEPSAVELAFHAVNLAEARHAQGQEREAERLLEEAIPTLEAGLGFDHPDLAIPYKARGAVVLALGRPARAEVDLRRSLALHERTGESPVEAAEARWLLARALHELERVDEAREHAGAAAEAFEALGPQVAPRAEEIRAWVAERRTAKAR